MKACPQLNQAGYTAVYPDLSLVGVQYFGQKLQRGALPAAIFPNQSYSLPFMYLKADPLKHRYILML